MTFDPTVYLQRIGYRGPASPTEEALREIHRAHLLTVPFENLSVRGHEPIALDEEALFEKIVVRRRGGFCYELNGLFASLLERLGFRVSRLAGRVGVPGIPFDHMALQVDLRERWLADVGFGDSFLLPLRLDSRDPQPGGCGRTYRLHPEGEGLVLLREGERQFHFTLQEFRLADFAPGCRYHQTSPRSSFTQKTVVSLATSSGRVTLSERRLIVTEGSHRTETDLPDVPAVTEVLSKRFGIEDPALVRAVYGV